MKVYEQLASLTDAAQRCDHSTTKVYDGDRDVTAQHWQDMARQHRARIDVLCANVLPSGSGWDNGTRYDHDRSTPNHLVLYGSWHHMDDNGSYDGWTDHEIHVRPSLAFGFDLRVTGRDRNEIKDYLAEMFDAALREECPDA